MLILLFYYIQTQYNHSLIYSSRTIFCPIKLQQNWFTNQRTLSTNQGLNITQTNPTKHHYFVLVSAHKS